MTSPLPSWVDLPAYFPTPANRVWLRRRLKGAGPPVAFIGHNPSTANGQLDDATARRCTGFANAWGASDLVMVNLATGIATDARALDDHPAPLLMAYEALAVASDFIGPAGVLIAAWGAPKGTAAFRSLIATQARLIPRDIRQRLHVLRFTASGWPEHPLYLPKQLVPVPWSAAP